MEDKKTFPILSPFISWAGAMINPQGLKLPMSRINFYRPKDVRAIEVLLPTCIMGERGWWRIYIKNNLLTKWKVEVCSGHIRTAKASIMCSSHIYVYIEYKLTISKEIKSVFSGTVLGKKLRKSISSRK